MKTSGKYAVIQHGVGDNTIIHGIGDTEQEAIEDALEYCEDVSGLTMALCEPFSFSVNDDIAHSFDDLDVIEEWDI